MLYIGIDLGTSAVKLLLMDGEGEIKNIVSKDYPLEFPRPGWSQQNPEDWKNAVLEGIPQLLQGFDPSQVAGIGAGGQMHGLVVLDRENHVIRPAILWNDGRTAKQVDYLNGVVGREKLSKLTANIAFAGFTAPKLLWMRENEPDLFARIAKIMLPKDYINYILTGVHCTDYSDASGMLLLDVEHKRWSAEMLELCGVTEAQMPRLFESYEKVGTLLPEIAGRLGLPENVAVCAGAGDNAAAAVGTGTVGEGACNISLGTSGTVFISSEKFGVDPHNALHAFAHADGHYHLMGCMLSAASCNKWLMEDIFEVAKSLGIRIDRSKICGGGAKSPLWKTIMANVLNICLDVPESEQGPGMGGAMLAMVACGLYPTVADACAKLARTAETVVPDPALSARYEARYRQFKSVYPALKDVFSTMNGVLP